MYCLAFWLDGDILGITLGYTPVYLSLSFHSTLSISTLSAPMVMGKFISYSAVAWGSSAALTIAIILADQMMKEKSDDQMIFFPKPNVGLTKCFLQDESQGLYLHVPIMLLMIVNGMFFTITTITLYRCKSNPLSKKYFTFLITDTTWPLSLPGTQDRKRQMIK